MKKIRKKSSTMPANGLARQAKLFTLSYLLLLGTTQCSMSNESGHPLRDGAAQREIRYDAQKPFIQFPRHKIKGLTQERAKMMAVLEQIINASADGQAIWQTLIDLDLTLHLEDSASIAAQYANQKPDTIGATITKPLPMPELVPGRFDSPNKALHINTDFPLAIQFYSLMREGSHAVLHSRGFGPGKDIEYSQEIYLGLQKLEQGVADTKAVYCLAAYRAAGGDYHILDSLAAEADNIKNYPLQALRDYLKKHPDAKSILSEDGQYGYLTLWLAGQQKKRNLSVAETNALARLGMVDLHLLLEQNSASLEKKLDIANNDTTAKQKLIDFVYQKTALPRDAIETILWFAGDDDGSFLPQGEAVTLQKGNRLYEGFFTRLTKDADFYLSRKGPGQFWDLKP